MLIILVYLYPGAENPYFSPSIIYFMGAQAPNILELLVFERNTGIEPAVIRFCANTSITFKSTRIDLYDANFFAKNSLQSASI